MLKFLFSFGLFIYIFLFFPKSVEAQQACQGDVRIAHATACTICPSGECSTRCQNTPSYPSEWYDYTYWYDCPGQSTDCNQNQAVRTCAYIKYWQNSNCTQEYPQCQSSQGCSASPGSDTCGSGASCIYSGDSLERICGVNYAVSNGSCAVISCGWSCQTYGNTRLGCYERRPNYPGTGIGTWSSQSECGDFCRTRQCDESCNFDTDCNYDAGMRCIGGKCRNPSCSNKTNCSCGGGCGASGQACCSPDNSCDSGLSCLSGFCGNTPPSCGASGQACCSGNSCNSGLSCSGGICQSNPPPGCGGRDQNCCSGISCDAGLVCRGGSCQPDSCGAQGERCCGGDRCDAGYNCVNDFCGNGPACNATCNVNAQNCPAGYTCFPDNGYKCRLTACPANSNCACDPPQYADCTVSVSPNIVVLTGNGTQQTVTASVNMTYGALKHVEFMSMNGAVFTNTPEYDGLPPLETVITAQGAGNTNLRVHVYTESAGIEGYHVRCQTTVPVQVLNIPAWWQAVDTDVFASGDLRSQIPSSCSGGSCTPQLILPGVGGYSGVPAYSGSATYGSGTVSSSGWNANTTYTGRRYDYDWYRSLAATNTEVVNCSGGCNLNSSDINAKAGADDVNVVVYEGNVTLTNNVNMNNNKIAIFVNGNLNINDRIQLNDGSGFFAAFVKGNIVVNPSVTHPVQPSVEGMLVSDGSFSTGSGSSRYYHRGSVVAWGGVSLQRDLAAGNQQTPAELFEYAPDLILNFPPQLFRDGVVWREIAP